jgi:hypothetical protein
METTGLYAARRVDEAGGRVRRRLTLLDQLELTVELLTDAEGAIEPELPPNVIRFRPLRTH